MTKELNEDLNTEKEINNLNKYKKIIFLVIKRIFDILIGFVGTIILIPIAIVVKILYLYDGDKNSIWFVQNRIGKDGKEFKLLKIRTMVVGADDILKKMLEENESLRKEYKEFKKLENDPRITKHGKFLRKTSLDEWPQFINVLIGDMSFIGNRPYLPREKDDMGDCYKNIIKMKPGITGLWQVSGRNEVAFEERLKIENEYPNNVGLKQDFKIFIKTFKVVFKGIGSK